MSTRTAVAESLASGDAVPQPSPRNDLIDALRGSALLGIQLLHSIEHWDFLRNPPNPPEWLKTLNTWTHETGFFLFGGKAYAIFALMFGVSFFLILDRWTRRGFEVRGRFLWRMAVLGVFGYLHGLVYCGDILLIIALLGVPLVFLHRLGSRALAWIGFLLVLQLPSLWQAGRVLLDSGFEPSQPLHWPIYGQLGRVFAEGSFLDVVAINAWTGQSSRLLWTIETGRYTQMLGLFVLGLLLGRSRVFGDAARCAKLARHALLWGALGFAVFYPIKRNLTAWGLTGLDRYYVDNLVASWCNLAQMALWVGAFLLLWQSRRVRSLLRLLAPYGRMSLTCYVTQGLIGVPLFYGFGFALYRHLGAFHSVFVGAGILVMQCTAAHWWLRRFEYGPLEWLWRAATFWTLDTPMRRRASTTAAEVPAAAPS
jgi:uncharacterized protein